MKSVRRVMVGAGISFFGLAENGLKNYREKITGVQDGAGQQDD